MKTELSELRLERPLPQHAQIRQHIRELIVTGRLAPGTRMPSTQEMAALWNANVLTVHTALTQLAREGLVLRVNRVGTFVRRPEAKLTCVGIYKAAERVERAPYIEAVQAALHAELVRLGIAVEVWSDARRLADRDTPMAAMQRAIQQREVQAVVCLSGGPSNFPWLTRLPVPVGYLGGTEPTSVECDFGQLAESSLRALRAQGCRRVGLIAPYPADRGTFYQLFTDTAQDLGLRLQNAWMRIPKAETCLQQEQFGYDQFRRLWSQAERPDGLVVTPESIARGVLTGILERQVDVPGELKLVFEKNESMELLCLRPATFLTLSERAIARGLIKQVQKQFRGERCEPVYVPFRPEAHAGSNQQ